jgi:hypothetical protein
VEQHAPPESAPNRRRSRSEAEALIQGPPWPRDQGMGADLSDYAANLLECAAAFTDPSTGEQAIRSIRVDKEVSVFPENPRRFLGEIGHLYYFRATVHHDDGPDEGAFAIEVTKRRDGTQSIFKVLKNIKTVSK